MFCDSASASLAEEAGFERSVPRKIASPFRSRGISRSVGETTRLREGPAVRILFPPAESQERTGPHRRASARAESYREPAGIPCHSDRRRSRADRGAARH